MTQPTSSSAEPVKPWSSDHTSLVHVLWGCTHDGLSLTDDFDTIASRIMSSGWYRATLQHAKDGVLRA